MTQPGKTDERKPPAEAGEMEQLSLMRHADVVAELASVLRFFNLRILERDGMLALYLDPEATAEQQPAAWLLLDEPAGGLPVALRPGSEEAGADTGAQPPPLRLLAVPLARARDYKPPAWADGLLEFPPQPDNLKGLLTRLEQRRQLPGGGELLLNRIIGESGPMQRIKRLMTQASLSDANVLLLGESGCGKEVIARTIHDMSARHAGPFIAINCGAIPSELLESELFGHEKGSFTGALGLRKGRFELANGGTLFLDEIGDMPLLMQVKLLRVLQERCFERVGGNQTIYTNVRLVAATHQNLEDKITAGAFRMDLFYRLHVFPIEIPPLRERREDIPLLAAAFGARMQTQYGTKVRLDDEALQTLIRHDFPGNVRELENLIERLAILYPDERISVRHLPARYRPDVESLPQLPLQTSGAAALPQAEQGSGGLEVSLDRGIDLKQFLTNLERSLIQQALEKNQYIVAKAAKTLSLQRTTLVEKIKKLNIDMAGGGP